MKSGLRQTRGLCSSRGQLKNNAQVLGGKVSTAVLCREPVDNLSPEERDARTVFCMQLAARIRPRDLEDFFSAVGKVTLFSLLVGLG